MDISTSPTLEHVAKKIGTEKLDTHVLYTTPETLDTPYPYPSIRRLQR